MEFLKLLESIRTPFGDSFFSAVTMLGEETVFIVIGIIFFWCINKKEGYYLFSIGLFGTVINQFLKLAFRIPRPWVKDKTFTIVESAREAATGYSFPSGHTQSSVGIFGGIARWNQSLIVRIICIVICVLVPLSRMYLGVHTPADVFVSIGIALILIFGIYPIIQSLTTTKNGIRILFGSMIALNIAYLLFVLFYNFPKDLDMHNYESGLKNAYKMLGCFAALWVSFEVDERFTHFETKAAWWVQALKLILGLIPIILIKTFLKAPLHALIGNEFIADGVRYFLLTVFAGCIWPMTFKFFNRLSKTNSNQS